jgi:hypothetical protein
MTDRIPCYRLNAIRQTRPYLVALVLIESVSGFQRSGGNQGSTINAPSGRTWRAIDAIARWTAETVLRYPIALVIQS